MHRLVPAVLVSLLLPAGGVRAADISASPAQLAALLNQPVALIVGVSSKAAGCVDAKVVENRGKAVMSRYRIPRAEKIGPDHQTVIFVSVTAFESTNQAGRKVGCDAAISMELSSRGNGFWAEWASDLGLIAGPEALTGGVADDVQEFIEALVAKAADPAVASKP